MRLTYRSRFMLVFFSLVLIFSASAYVIHDYAVRQWNSHIFQGYAKNAIYRAELALDYAVLAAGKISDINATYCSRNDQRKLQKTVFASGALKDIRLRDGKLTCWAFPENEAAVGQLIDKAPKQKALNSNYYLFSLGLKGWDSLGVQWRSGYDKDITEIINTGNIVFDILPPEIRSKAEIELGLDNGAVFSRYASQPLAVGGIKDYDNFEASSDRYPLHARVRVADPVLSSWNSDLSPLATLVILVGIFAISFLITRGLVRPEGFAGELAAAIRNGEIMPYYQPVIDLKTGEMTGMEMLARWIKPDGEMVSPAKFIPVAEETGQICTITSALLEIAGKEVGPLLRRQSWLKMTFNITPGQFLRDGFVDSLVSGLKVYGLPAQSMVVEVTERQSISDPQKAAVVCAEFAKAGIRVAIDDAGTGHNGLSSLHGLGAQFLKIDKYFIDCLSLDNKASILIEMLVSLAREFGMTTVAEGIETEEQAERLRKLGVPEAQGFLFARPLPAQSLLEFAENNARGPAEVTKLANAG